MTSLALQDLLRGRGAHVDPVACLTGLSAAEAGRSLAPNLHTIWQLVWHMNYWMDYELRSIDGPEVPYPEHAEESWPGGTAPADEATWRLELTLFEKQVERLAGWAGHAAVGGLGSRVVHRAKGESLETVLWQMVAHNSYHIGQVAQLRRAFGLWPPAGGGDSW